MLKLMSGILTLALLATGCSSSTWSGTIGGRGAATTDSDDQRGGKPSGGDDCAPTHGSTVAHRPGSSRTSRCGTGTKAGGTSLPRIHAAGRHNTATGVEILNRF